MNVRRASPRGAEDREADRRRIRLAAVRGVGGRDPRPAPEMAGRKGGEPAAGRGWGRCMEPMLGGVLGPCCAAPHACTAGGGGGGGCGCHPQQGLQEGAQCCSFEGGGEGRGGALTRSVPGSSRAPLAASYMPRRRTARRRWRTALSERRSSPPAAHGPRLPPLQRRRPPRRGPRQAARPAGCCRPAGPGPAPARWL
jgi:hypothetical protein